MLAINFDDFGFLNIKQYTPNCGCNEFLPTDENTTAFCVLKSCSMSAAFIGLYKLDNVLKLLCEGSTVILTTQESFDKQKVRQYRFENLKQLPTYTVIRTSPELVDFLFKETILNYSTYKIVAINLEVQKLLPGLQLLYRVGLDYYFADYTSKKRLRQLVKELSWKGFYTTLKKEENVFKLSVVTL